MKDFNFFSPYIETKKGSGLKSIYIILAGAIVVVLMISIAVFNAIWIGSMKNELSTMKIFLASPQTAKQLVQYEKTKQKLRLAQEYYGKLQGISNEINEADKLNSDLMKKISDCLPQKVFFSNMAIAKNNVQIKGTAKSRSDIAEFEHNIKTLGIFNSVHVNDINFSQEGQIYDFTIGCKLGDVNTNEADK